MNIYEETHIKTYRYKCLKTDTGFPINAKGNYESLLSFKKLPSFKELKHTGRSWKYTKQYAPVMDRIVLDIDCDNDLEKAFEITKTIMQDLAGYKDSINIYFSGSKGFHIEILTDELDIIDTSADKPMDSCYQYVEFLNYYQDKFQEVDLSLKDVGTRIIRVHHTKHEKTGNYKILVNLESSLDDIILNSQSNKDMVNPTSTYLSRDKSMNLLSRFRKPLENRNQDTLVNELTSSLELPSDKIFSDVFNELTKKGDRHKIIGLLGAGLNGYVTKSELKGIYKELQEHTTIEESINAEQSFYNAFDNDRLPCNLGALKNHYDKNKIDPSNFYALSDYLNSKLLNKDYQTFQDKIQTYEYDWFNMLESEMFDYVDNTENIFKGVINSLSALFGYGSRFIVVNGGAEVGKSEFIKTIDKLMPRFKNLGSSTPASIRRQQEQEFNKKIIYLGDKGLKGKDDEEFKGLQEVFGGLITEGEFIRDLVVGDSIMEFNLKSDGVCVFYSEPYTNLRVFGAGDQYTTRTTYITVNPVLNGLQVFLQDENKDNPFYNIHKNYIKYILKNPLDLEISLVVKTELYNASNSSLRTAKYLLGLFKAYSQYLRIQKPSKEDVLEFLQVFKPRFEITDIEYEVYLKLYKNLLPVKESEIRYLTDDDGEIDHSQLLTQIADRKYKSLFTAKQIKTYFKNDFKMNKNLKDTIDNIPEILNNLYMADYLERLEQQYNNQNVYYLPYNADLDY